MLHGRRIRGVSDSCIVDQSKVVNGFRYTCENFFLLIYEAQHIKVQNQILELLTSTLKCSASGKHKYYSTKSEFATVKRVHGMGIPVTLLTATNIRK